MASYNITYFFYYAAKHSLHISGIITICSYDLKTILYGMEWEGQSVERLAAGGWEVKVTFDDGVTQDRQTNLNEGVMLVGAGLLSKYKFLTDKKFGQGLTDKEAADELQRIRDEHQQTVSEEQVRLYGGGA